MTQTAPSKKILGIDPGEQTGWAVLICENGRAKLQGFGVIPVTEPGRLGLLRSVYNWLSTHTDGAETCFSEIVQMPRVPTSHPAVEAQGVVRLWGATGYNPSTVHSQLGTRKKSDVAGYLERLFGVRVRPDHAADACASALCHGVKTGVITRLDVAPKEEPSGLRAPRGKRIEEKSDYSNDELIEMIRTGKAKIA